MVKLYTKGVKVENSSPRNTAVSLLSEVVEKGLTLKDVEEAIEITKKCKEKGLALEDALNFLNEV